MYIIITVYIWLYEGSHLRMKLPSVWSPERKRSLRFASGELRRLLSPRGVWSPCGPQLLPAVVEAPKERVSPVVSLEHQVIPLMDSSLLASSSSISSSSESLSEPHSRQGVQVSPYLNKNEKRTLHWISPGPYTTNVAKILLDVDGGDVPSLLRLLPVAPNTCGK